MSVLFPHSFEYFNFFLFVLEIISRDFLGLLPAFLTFVNISVGTITEVIPEIVFETQQGDAHCHVVRLSCGLAEVEVEAVIVKVD